VRTIKRSALFKRQLLQITRGYRQRAGSSTALKFVSEVESAIEFVAGQPDACAVYTRLAGIDFRKWRVSGFPVSVFFRVAGDNVIVLEALYAHRMDIAARIQSEIE
jgi:plasmid stabilization system protein ParE